MGCESYRQIGDEHSKARLIAHEVNAALQSSCLKNQGNDRIEP